MKHLLPLAALVALSLSAAAVTGCAVATVQPWDRDLLAKPSMRFQPHPLMTVVDEHIYFSKEASVGGQGVGGGGCGCN